MPPQHFAQPYLQQHCLLCRCCEGLQSGVWGADDEGDVTQSGVMSSSERENLRAGAMPKEAMLTDDTEIVATPYAANI